MATEGSETQASKSPSHGKLPAKSAHDSEEPSPRRAVSYLRVSSSGQIHGDGFTRQRDAITRRASAQGLLIVAEFKDEGVSGTKGLQDRPGLTALVEHVSGNGVRMVLIERADRLARDLIEGELILREFRRLGVKVVEVEGGTDLTDGDSNPTTKLIRQVLGAVAEFEKSALVAKLKAARARRRSEQGRCEGPVPFGQLPGEEDALRDLLRLARKRNGKRPSAAAIAEAMDELGHRPRRGEKWNRSTVRAILWRRRMK